MSIARVRIDSDLWHAAKVEAARSRRSLQDVVADALRSYLETSAASGNSQMTGTSRHA